jgi:hypothetical protein
MIVVSWYIGFNVFSEKRVFPSGPSCAHGSLNNTHVLSLFESVIYMGHFRMR